MTMKYAISELFTSIQGEGEVMGIPSHFIRLYRCDLTCSWCDSKYTWVRQDQAVEGKDYTLMTIEEILGWLQNEPRAPLVTFTGGEPMLQPLLPLVTALDARGYQMVVETNGLHTPEQALLDLVHHWAVSPKLKNAGMTDVAWGPLDWLGKAQNSYLKFVICDPARDLPEVQEFVESRGLPSSRVILQPDGLAADYEVILRRLAEFGRDRGYPYRVLPQLHRLLWGVKRGI
ncbi:MAG TPA: 7-carboxy-7-deazaguanine synthase QueE [Candidatus Methylomirabilis sp.]|nr:7-carboxy-7-deazaguanine synthase QueE [Candidatus Methylomirabilis sp.]